jgi:pimeloyl-ACP methyl ester carboxylesterase
MANVLNEEKKHQVLALGRLGWPLRRIHQVTRIRREPPALSITGKYDQIVPPFYSQELADLIPIAKRAEIPSGHLSFLEKPVDLASAMLTFLLQKHPQRLGA